MVQMRLAGGSSGAGGRSWKPFSLALWLVKDNLWVILRSNRDDRFAQYVMWVPARAVSLAVVTWLKQQLSGICGRRCSCAKQQVLVLGQILCRSLLSCSCTMQQLSLQQWEVCLK